MVALGRIAPLVAPPAKQACNDPTAWPFAGLAHAVAELLAWITGEPQHSDFTNLARSIAALDPDLIIHVGDYLYRESPCPENDAGCAGSPYGYNWATIEAVWRRTFRAGA